VHAVKVISATSTRRASRPVGTPADAVSNIVTRLLWRPSPGKVLIHTNGRVFALAPMFE
jgi:hypothetical protein